MPSPRLSLAFSTYLMSSNLSSAVLLVPGLGPPGPLERAAMTRSPETTGYNDETKIPCCANEENSPTGSGGRANFKSECDSAGRYIPFRSRIEYKKAHKHLSCCRHRRVYRRSKCSPPLSYYKGPRNLLPTKNLPVYPSNLLYRRKLRAIHVGLQQLSRGTQENRHLPKL